MKKLCLIGLFLLSSCGQVNSIPKPPENSNVVNNDVPIPVLCKITVEGQTFDIDSASVGMMLELQNAMLRSTIADQRAYITKLEAAIKGCGGTIKR